MEADACLAWKRRRKRRKRKEEEEVRCVVEEVLEGRKQGKVKK